MNCRTGIASELKLLERVGACPPSDLSPSDSNVARESLPSYQSRGDNPHAFSVLGKTENAALNASQPP